MTNYFNNQKGVAHIIVIIVLILGLVLGLYLVSQRTNIFPKASTSGPVSPQTTFILSPVGAAYVGNEFKVGVFVRTDIDQTNLFRALIKFTPSQVEVVRIERSSSFITQWAEEFYDNSTGEISLTGGVPDPGVKTTTSSAPLYMATIVFKAKQAGSANLSFAEGTEIYRNSDSTNIARVSDGLVVTINSSTQPSPTLASTFQPTPTAAPTIAPTSTPKPTLTPSPSPKATPSANKGDSNNDGRINLVDLSILLKYFNKTSGFPVALDMNSDGIVNGLDFTLLRDHLATLKVIRGYIISINVNVSFSSIESSVGPFTITSVSQGKSCVANDPNCFYQATINATNNTNKVLYTPTIYTSAGVNKVSYIDFSGNQVSGTSTSQTALQPGQSISTNISVTPSTQKGTSTSTFFFTGRQCNELVPSDCVAYSASSYAVKVNVQ